MREETKLLKKNEINSFKGFRRNKNKNLCFQLYFSIFSLSFMFDIFHSYKKNN